jgi:hypothetical protein
MACTNWKSGSLRTAFLCRKSTFRGKWKKPGPI